MPAPTSTASPRRLAAIMFTEMVGHDELMQRDEALAFVLLEEHNRLVRASLKEYQGREIRVVGHAFLVEFESALQAVRCAISVQVAISVRNAANVGAALSAPLNVRVGIHLGDVVSLDGDIYGDGVNIAARVQSSADAGEIRVSEDVARQVMNKVAARFQDLGFATLKNITEPVRLFAVADMGDPIKKVAPPAAAPTTAATPPPSPPKSVPVEESPSIAVLAFANRSASADDEYFSDGLADELLNVLTKIQGLRVAARTSAFSFKQKKASISEIGHVLNVATVLEGSVRKSGNRVRIAVQLVKVKDGFQMWSESYDRTLDDIFAVQDDIAQSVVNELRKRLMEKPSTAADLRRAEADVATAAKGRSDDSEAHRLYLHARFLMNRRTPDDMAKCVEYLRKAVQIDPNSALLWATLSTALTDAVDYSIILRGEEATQQALDAATRALALEPDAVEAHVAMCHCQTMLVHDWTIALMSAQRALAISPDDSGALREAAKLFAALGRLDEALACAQRAVALDPLNAICVLGLARMFSLMDRWAEAESVVRRARELSPEGAGIHSLLARTLLFQGKPEAALAELVNEPWYWLRLQTTSEIHFRTGNLVEGDRAHQELIEKFSGNAAFNVAILYGCRGDADQCFSWLDRAYQQHDSGLTHVKVVYPLRWLHKDPRWPQLLEKLGLAENPVSNESPA